MNAKELGDRIDAERPLADWPSEYVMGEDVIVMEGTFTVSELDRDVAIGIVELKP